MQCAITDPFRGRSAVAAVYLAASVPVGSWIGRLPDIKISLQASNVSWGWVVSLGTMGEIVGFTLIAVLIGRLSTRRLAVVSAAAVTVLTPLMAVAPTLAALTLSMFAWLLTGKVLGTTMGALALVEQQRAGRVLMGQYDAIYSLGMLGGGALAWIAISAGISPSQQFAVTSVVLLVGLAAAVRHLPDEGRSTAASENILRRLRLRLRPGLLLLAGISCVASVIDSTLAVWGAILLSSMAGGDPSWGSLVYPIVMLSKIIVLLGLARLVPVAGWSVMLYVSLALAGVGIVTANVATRPELALLGFAFVGAGTAILGPFVNTSAGEQRLVTAGEARTVLELGEIPAYLATPAVVALLSTVLGLRSATLIIILAAALGGGILGYRQRRKRHTAA